MCYKRLKISKGVSEYIQCVVKRRSRLHKHFKKTEMINLDDFSEV